MADEQHCDHVCADESPSRVSARYPPDRYPPDGQLPTVGATSCSDSSYSSYTSGGAAVLGVRTEGAGEWVVVVLMEGEDRWGWGVQEGRHPTGTA